MSSGRIKRVVSEDGQLVTSQYRKCVECTSLELIEDYRKVGSRNEYKQGKVILRQKRIRRS